MAILSLSSDGLQNSLDKLKVYCDKWHLELNTTKTKIIVFSTTGRQLKVYMKRNFQQQFYCPP